MILLATSTDENTNQEDKMWASIILKVMHTIIHADKDLRYRYFQVIQQQIFDRIYKYLIRDENNRLFLGDKDSDIRVELIDFQTKAKKTRDSIIIKLLSKAENVAEELFDRIGVRFITKNKLDTLRVMNFLQKYHVIMPHNVKPSRTLNTLFNVVECEKVFNEVISSVNSNNMTEEEFVNEVDRRISETIPKGNLRENVNVHSSEEYRSIHFTCRQLIKYRDPFLTKFYDVRNFAKEMEAKLVDMGDSDGKKLVNKLLNLDTSSLTREIRFFYPFEVQITDFNSHEVNSKGEASHKEYKNAQKRTAMLRLFKNLVRMKNIEI